MIEEKLRLELDSIFKKYKEIEQVVLFGSRARQDNKYNSDIDLCLFGEKNNTFNTSESNYGYRRSKYTSKF